MFQLERSLCSNSWRWTSFFAGDFIVGPWKRHGPQVICGIDPQLVTGNLWPEEANQAWEQGFLEIEGN